MIHLSRAVNVIAVVLFTSVLVSFGPSASSVAQEQGSRPVVVADVKGAIGVGTTLLLEEALAVARRREAELVVLQIDTPGGLVSATREVIQKILASRIPIAVYVSPSGARAASAGTYIAYAAHVSAMAPGTHLGAATPISLGPARPTAPGQPPPRQPNQPADNAPSSAAERKVLNDAISYLKSLAQLRGRNVEWAEKAVRDAATLTADEALKAGVVDFVAKDLSGLFRQIDGREVQTAVGARRLVVRNAIVVPVEPTWKTQIITTLTNPNIAFILLMIGFYG
ncbi:MAG: nodulation protein NfeD, partial [Pseudomonadota bacterium]